MSTMGGRSKGALSLVAGLLLSLAFLSAASPQDYTIGAGDVLAIMVWSHPDLSRDYPVDPDGFVPFPLLGRVKATGLTTKEFAARLTELLEKDFLVNPHVIISVKEYLSQKVHVLGGPERAGLYYLKGPTTLLEILSTAGGVSKAAGNQLILVRNHRPPEGGRASGNVILRLNLEKIQTGDPKENIRVEDGDTIFVPAVHAFFVLGEVRSPGTFPLQRETTALEAVILAGGFSEKASPSGVKLMRRTPTGEQETLSLDLSGEVPKDQAVTIQAGDTLLVAKGNTFFVFGEVKRPGAYQLEKETNILEGITIAGGFSDKAAPGRTRVIRTTPAGPQVLHVDMNDIIRRGQRDKAIRLQESDVVVVPESFF